MTLFMVLTTAIFGLIAIFIPKKMTAIEMLTSCLFVGVLVMELDFIVDLKYDVYGYIGKGVQWFGVFIQIVIYPAVNIIMLNYFPYKKELKYKVSYIIVTAVLFTAYEWLTVKVGFAYTT